MMNIERIPDWEHALQSDNCTVRCVRRCASTMDIARDIVNQPQRKRYTIVLTETQEAGRGRQGRSWTPPELGLFATFSMHTHKPVHELSGFSLVAGYVVAGVLESLGCDARLKWPNDVYSESKGKLCGILIEIIYLDQGVGVLTGVGINLKGEPPGLNATSVHSLSGGLVSQLDVASVLNPALFDAWEEFEKNGFSSFKGRWLKKALYLNQPISIEVGGVRREGTMRGVDEAGLLLLEEQGRVNAIPSGEIMNLRPIQ